MGSGTSGLPTNVSGRPASLVRHPRRQSQRTYNNIKVTILCGLITILVLRGTIGLSNLVSPGAEAENQHLIEETNRILAAIRAEDDGGGSTEPVGEREPEEFLGLNDSYSLGPQIRKWNQIRKVWFQRNPGFPSYVNGNKPRILLVTGSPPNPCDNKIGDHYLDKEMAGYWAKLPLIRRLMLSHPEVEWIWWMDSDAFFTDMEFEVPLVKHNNHNMVIHGYPDLLFNHRSWIALNTGSFLLRNCQWSLDLLDAWTPMGPKGPIREEAGKVLTANLKGRPEFEADDQSALIYLLIMEKDKWMSKVFVENSYYLHGFWEGLVERYEEMIEKHHPGLGDDRWPFVTHFVGCKPCGSYGDYPVERCLKSMERAFNFADNQVLSLYGFRHRGLSSPNIKMIRNETAAAALVNVDRFDIRHSVKKSSGSKN